MTSLESITAWMSELGFTKIKVETINDSVNRCAFTHTETNFTQRFYFNTDGTLTSIGTSIPINHLPTNQEGRFEQYVADAKKLISIGMSPIYVINSNDKWSTESGVYMAYLTLPELDRTQMQLLLTQLCYLLCGVFESENLVYRFKDCAELMEMQNQLECATTRILIRNKNGYFRDKNIGDADLFVIQYLTNGLMTHTRWESGAMRTVVPKNPLTKTQQYIDYLRNKFKVSTNEVFQGFI